MNNTHDDTKKNRLSAGYTTCSHEGIGVPLYPRIIASILWIHVFMGEPSIVSGYLMCRAPMTL